MVKWSFFNNNSGIGSTYFSRGNNLGTRGYNGLAFQVGDDDPPPPPTKWAHIRWRHPNWYAQEDEPGTKEPGPVVVPRKLTKRQLEKLEEFLKDPDNAYVLRNKATLYAEVPGRGRSPVYDVTDLIPKEVR